jgi:hypothetical protein
MAATSIILCLLLRGRSRNQISTFFCQWLSEVWNKVPAAIRIGQFICLRVKAPSSAWEAPRLNLPICYRAGPGHLILHPAFESRSRGISWRVLDDAWKRKESTVRCTGGTPSLIIYGAQEPSYLCLCRQAVCSILFFFPSVHLINRQDDLQHDLPRSAPVARHW